MGPEIDSSQLSRFILQKNWYRSSDNRVKHATFMPNSNGETSVFRTSDISDKEIWDIGDREVGLKRNKPILGRADIISSIVTSKDLKIIPKEPPERHANLTGWSSERSEQRMIAIELAAESHLQLK